MRTANELLEHAGPATASDRDAPARGDAPVVFLHRGPASNDAAPADPPAPRAEGQTWVETIFAAYPLSDTAFVVAQTKPGAWEMHEAARAYRAYSIGEIIATLVMGTVDLLRAAAALWRQRRHEKAVQRAFQALDDHALRDLGLHRSELGSLAAEVSGRAERTRMLSVLTRNGFLM